MNKLSLVLLLLCSTVTVQARTFHAVGIFSTKYTGQTDALRSGVRNDMDAFISLSLNIAGAIGYKIDTAIISGENFNLSNARALIDKVTVLPGDMVFLYVDCVGYRFRGQVSPFPTALISNSQSDEDLQGNGLDFESYCQKFIAKNPKLFVGVIEACNKGKVARAHAETEFSWLQGMQPPQSQQIISGRLQDLFMNVKGSLLMSSSSAGEDAFFNDGGNEFTANFFHQLTSALGSGATTSWDTIFSSAKKETSERIISLASAKTKAAIEPGSTQTPIIRNNTVQVPPMPEVLPDPPYPVALTAFEKLEQLGLAHYNEHEYKKALDAFKKALELRPYSSYARFYIYLCEVPMDKPFSTIKLTKIGQWVDDPDIKAYMENKDFGALQFYIAVSYLKKMNGCPRSWKDCLKWAVLSDKNGFEPAGERLRHWGE